MIFKNACILNDSFRFVKGSLEVNDGVITAVNEGNTSAAVEGEIDVQGKKIIPGLIDVHMHGYASVACSDADPERIRMIGRALAKKGVTSYAATIGSAKDDTALGGIRANAKAKVMEDQNRTGSRILGMHMEGPFLNIKKKGGMDPRNIVAPTLDRLISYMEAGGQEAPVRIMTIAPEMEGAEDVIRYGAERGIQFSLGHTDATQEEAEKAINWGANRATHTFNAMRALNHREIGVLGVSLTDDRLQCEMICDFVHLKKEICKMIYLLKGTDKVTVISDSLQLAGMDPEDIPAGLGVEVRDALYLPDGTLCGSIGNVMIGVRNLVSIGIPLEDSVKMASINPARDVNADKELGSIAVGKKADLVILDDDLEVSAVYIDGKKM